MAYQQQRNSDRSVPPGRTGYRSTSTTPQQRFGQGNQPTCSSSRSEPRPKFNRPVKTVTATVTQPLSSSSQGQRPGPSKFNGVPRSLTSAPPKQQPVNPERTMSAPTAEMPENSRPYTSGMGRTVFEQTHPWPTGIRGIPRPVKPILTRPVTPPPEQPKASVDELTELCKRWKCWEWPPEVPEYPWKDDRSESEKVIPEQNYYCNPYSKERPTRRAILTRPIPATTKYAPPKRGEASSKRGARRCNVIRSKRKLKVTCLADFLKYS